MTKLVVSTIVLLLLSAIVLPSCTAEDAQPRVIHFVSLYSVGGSTDVEVRGISPYFQKYYGTTVINENRTGGGGNIGINFVYEKPADGKYVLVSSATASIKKLLNPEAAIYGESFFEAFIPIGSWITAGGNVLATPKDSSIKTLDDFIAAAKQRRLSIGVPPAGSSDHMNVLMLEKALGCKFSLIPYEGGSDVVFAVMGGHIDAGIAGFQSFGDVNAVNLLGITSSERIPDFPAPTFTELGFPQVTSEFVVGSFVKAGTSQKIVDDLDEAFRKAHDDPEYQGWLKERGITVSPYKDQEAWTSYLKDWASRIESIVPELQASMEELAK